jgi:hypothetical protein
MAADESYPKIAIRWHLPDDQAEKDQKLAFL